MRKYQTTPRRADFARRPSLSARRPVAWLTSLLPVLPLVLGCQTTVPPKQAVAPPPSPPVQTQASTAPAVGEVALVPDEGEPAKPEAEADGPPASLTFRIDEARLVPPRVDDPVKVGLLLPLSGRAAEVGLALRDAALMALFELGTDRIVLLPADTRGTAAGAEAAAERVLAQGAGLILGPLFRDAVDAAKGPARARGVNLIAFSTDRTVAEPDTFLMGFTPEQQIERVVAHATAQGLWRFAALVPNGAYGRAVVQALHDATGRFGAEVIQVEYYAADGNGAVSAIKRLGGAVNRGKIQKRGRKRELPFDALLLPEGGGVLRQVAPLLPYYDLGPSEVRVIGTGLWDDPALRREPALTGGWFAAPPPVARNRFVERFQAVYGRRPARIASLAYDAAALAAVLGGGEGSPRFDAGTLAAPSGFAGSDGIFRFRPDGIGERGLAVIEIHPDGFKVVSDAPSSFQSLSY